MVPRVGNDLMRRRILRTAVMSIIVMIALYLALPRIMFLMIPILSPDENGLSERLLILCGPRVIGPAIDGIRENGGDRDYQFLPHLVAHFGERGHRALLHRIDSENLPDERVRLIHALFLAFADRSRLKLAVDDEIAGRLKATSCYKTQDVLHYSLPEAPSILGPTGGIHKINPEFLDWYRQNSHRLETNGG